MKRRRKLLILAGVFVAAVLVVALWPGEKEPEYQGKKLSQWLFMGRFALPRSGQEREAQQAIRQIGTNCLPFLVKAISYEPPSWNMRLRAAVRRLPAKFAKQAEWRLVEYKAEDRAYNAQFGFEALGERAAPAAPQLASLVVKSNYYPVVTGSMHALACIGEAGFGPLMRVLSDPKSPNRREAAVSLCEDSPLGPSFSNSVPMFIELLTDRDPAIAGKAAHALGRIAIRPGVCVPALAKQVCDPQAGGRVTAANALGHFGERARSAVPCLLVGLGDSFVDMRTASARALEKIAPEVLTNGVSGR